MTKQVGLKEVGSLSEQILEQIERAVVGKRGRWSSSCSGCWLTATC